MTVDIDNMLPLAPLIASLGVLATIGIFAWRARDFIATRSELIEVKDAIELCARKSDLESLRATVTIHTSQTNQALKEIQIEIARLDERSAVRWGAVHESIKELRKDSYAKG